MKSFSPMVRARLRAALPQEKAMRTGMVTRTPQGGRQRPERTAGERRLFGRLRSASAGEAQRSRESPLPLRPPAYPIMETIFA